LRLVFFRDCIIDRHYLSNVKPSDSCQQILPHTTHLSARSIGLISECLLGKGRKELGLRTVIYYDISYEKLYYTSILLLPHSYPSNTTKINFSRNAQPHIHHSRLPLKQREAITNPTPITMDKVPRQRSLVVNRHARESEMCLVEEVGEWQERRSHGRVCLDIAGLAVDDVRHGDAFVGVVGVAVDDGGGVDDAVGGHWEHSVGLCERLRRWRGKEIA
jgi:hypothetical protein